jgi:hypothetical protein
MIALTTQIVLEFVYLAAIREPNEIDFFYTVKELVFFYGMASFYLLSLSFGLLIYWNDYIDNAFLNPIGYLALVFCPSAFLFCTYIGNRNQMNKKATNLIKKKRLVILMTLFASILFVVTRFFVLPYGL